MDKIRFSAHLRENAANLFPGDHHIVGPLDPGIQPQLSHRLRHCQRHDQRERTCLIRRAAGSQQYGEIKVAALRGKPAPAPSSSSRILPFRDHKRSFRRPLLSGCLGVDVGGARHGVKDQVLPCPSGVQAAFDFTFSQQIRRREQAVASVLHRLDLIAFFF